MRYYFVILCGAVTLEARTSNKMWNIAAVIPVDKRIGSGSGGGGSNDSSSGELILKENFLKICAENYL